MVGLRQGVIMISCTLGPLAQCAPRELVQVKVGDPTEWAIVGAEDPGYFPLIVLSGDGAPFVLNVSPDPGEFETRAVAKYGTNYRFAFDPMGPCQIGDGTLSKTVGSVVLTDDGDWHLIVNNHMQKGVRWFHLESGKITGEPGLQRIAFGSWSLFIEGLKQEPSEFTLLEFPKPSAVHSA
jgi:hypothetical protein